MGSSNPVPQAPATPGADGGEARVSPGTQLGELGQQSARLPSWRDVRVDTRSPHPRPPSLGRDTSACFIGLAGQERSETALMGEAFIYSGETKYVKGHCRQ